MVRLIAIGLLPGTASADASTFTMFDVPGGMGTMPTA
jgi:hypothetical protein